MIVIYLLALSVALAESIIYPGVFRAHSHIPALLVYIAGLSVFLRPRKLPGLSLLTALTSILYLAFNLVESFTYENYIFSHLHINLRGFEHLTIFLIFSFFLSRRSGESFRPLVRSGVIAAITFLALSNFVATVPFIITRLTPIISTPLATYDQKMTDAYPGFYPAMQIVKSLTPESSTIIIPPQGAPWVTEGNAFLVKRFLYPRKIIHLDQDAPLTPDTYFLIARGSWPTDGTYEYGWPKTEIPAIRIWEFDLTSSTATSYARNYDPTRDSWDWGLMEAQYD